MPTQGPNIAGTGATDNARSAGAVAWTNPSNITADDGTYATVSLDTQTSHDLIASNFGFTLPAGAVVQGIQIGIEAKADATGGGPRLAPVPTVNDLSAAVTGSPRYSIDMPAEQYLSTSDTLYSNFGSAASNPGSFTREEVNDAGFCYRCVVQAPFATAVVSVDRIQATVTYVVPEAAITGTATASNTEADVVAGGKTIIITLTDATWVAAGAAFDAQRQNIINGLDSAQAEATGWDAVVKATQVVTGVVRTSDTVVTITLDAFATYDISANETITVTVPGTAVSTGVAITGSPTIAITFIPSVIPQQRFVRQAVNRASRW